MRLAGTKALSRPREVYGHGRGHRPRTAGADRGCGSRGRTAGADSGRHLTLRVPSSNASASPVERALSVCTAIRRLGRAEAARPVARIPRGRTGTWKALAVAQRARAATRRIIVCGALGLNWATAARELGNRLFINLISESSAYNPVPARPGPVTRVTCHGNQDSLRLVPARAVACRA